MKAMILAAGEGTRLRPLTRDLPKPIVPIANTPLLVRTIQLLAAQNITEIGINLYHKPDRLRRTLGNGEDFGVRLHYSEEPTLMGTAGGVKRMESFLDETFLVLYGDNLYYADFRALLATHKAKKAAGTIASFTTPNPTACGLILTDMNGRITRFQEKPPASEVFTDQANAGVYILEPEILSTIPPETVCDFGKDIFPNLLASGNLPLFAAPLNGYLQDTGTPGNYRKANWDMLDGANGTNPLGENGLLIGDGTRIHPMAKLTGRNSIGANCVIGANTVLHETILWDNGIIGDNVRLSNCVVAYGVTIAPNSDFTDRLIASGD